MSNDMEKRKNVRKITADDLNALIDGEPTYIQPEGSTITTCYLKTKCGIVLTGNSGCLNPRDFDAKIGQEIAYANAYSQLWQLEGYARLRVHVDGLNKADTMDTMGLPPHELRMLVEYDEIHNRTEKLGEFILGQKFKGLPEEMRMLMTEQHGAMLNYEGALVKRINLNGGTNVQES